MERPTSGAATCRQTAPEAIRPAVALTFGACTIGSGDMVSEVRPVEGFDRVVLASSGDVEIRLTGTESVEVQAEEDLRKW